MKDNNITCPACNHEFSLGDLQQKLVEEKATAMNEKWQKEQSEMMEIEKKKELMKALEEATIEQDKKLKKQEKEKELLELELRKANNNKQSDIERIKAEAEKKHEAEKRLLDLTYKEQRAQDARKLKETLEKLNKQSISSQVLGEVGENYVVEELSSAYPSDIFIPIKVGEEGGDWIQEVSDEKGTTIGQIYIESKNTKTFQKSWIPKLQKDMEDRNITTGVLISKNFLTKKQGLNAYVDQGIPIYKLDANIFVSHIGLLRDTLKKLFIQAQVGEIEKSDIPNKVFEYLNSDKFKNQMQQIAGVLKTHRDRIQERQKDYVKYLKQDDQLLKDLVRMLRKTLKNDINEITSEEIVSLPELEELTVRED